MSNVTLPATGAIIATDTVDGKELQVVKLDIGARGFSIPLSSANPMPIGGIITLDSTSLAAITATTPLAIQPVSVTSLPLPSGAAIASLQPALNTDGGALSHITNLPATQAISAIELPLPSGAATSANQTSQNNTLSTLALESGGTLAAILAKLITAPATASAQTSIIAAIQAGLYPSENHVGIVSGQTVAVSTSFNRPTNVTAYAALGTIADSTTAPTILTFTNIARINGGSGYIVKARIATDQITNVARIRLHLYSSALPLTINDSSPYTELYTNLANKIGHIDFDMLNTEGVGSTAASALNSSARLAYICVPGSRNIYGMIETRDIFTPTSGQKFFIELTTEQN